MTHKFCQWPADNLPDCLQGYDGIYCATVWYKALCETFSEKCPVGKHWRQFRSHQDCFVASDAVTWVRRELKTDKFKANISRAQTVGLLRMMHLVHQVFEDIRGPEFDREPFADNGRLFRFRSFKICDPSQQIPLPPLSSDTDGKVSPTIESNESSPTAVKDQKCSGISDDYGPLESTKLESCWEEEEGSPVSGCKSLADISPYEPVDGKRTIFWKYSGLIGLGNDPNRAPRDDEALELQNNISMILENIDPICNDSPIRKNFEKSDVLGKTRYPEQTVWEFIDSENAGSLSSASSSGAEAEDCESIEGKETVKGWRSRTTSELSRLKKVVMSKKLEWKKLSFGSRGVEGKVPSTKKKKTGKPLKNIEDQNVVPLGERQGINCISNIVGGATLGTSSGSINCKTVQTNLTKTSLQGRGLAAFKYNTVQNARPLPLRNPQLESNKIAIFESLCKLLDVADISEVFDPVHINAQWLFCNIAYSGSDGIVANIDVTDKFPDWIVEALKKLGQYNGSRTGQGNAQELFDRICTYFGTLTEPVFTLQMHSVFAGVAVCLLENKRSSFPKNLLCPSSCLEDKRTELKNSSVFQSLDDVTCFNKRFCASSSSSNSSVNSKSAKSKRLSAFDDDNIDLISLQPVQTFPFGKNRLLDTRRSVVYANRFALEKEDGLSDKVKLVCRNKKNERIFEKKSESLSSLVKSEMNVTDSETVWNCQRNSTRDCGRAGAVKYMLKKDMARQQAFKCTENMNKHCKNYGKTVPYIPPVANGDLFFCRQTCDETSPFHAGTEHSELKRSAPVISGSFSSISFKNGIQTDNMVGTSEDSNELGPIWRKRSSTFSGSPTILTISKNMKSVVSHDSLFVNVPFEKLKSAMQLCCLMLSPSARHKSFVFFQFAEMFLHNAKLVADRGRTKRQLILEAFSASFLTAQNPSEFDDQLTSSIFAFIFDNYADILKVPKEFATCNKENQQHDQQRQVEPSHCSRVSKSEYENQRSNETHQCLMKLLQAIVNDKSLTEKARRNRLDMFQVSYPEIYNSYFPATANPAQPKSKVRTPSFRRSFLRLKNLRL